MFLLFMRKNEKNGRKMPDLTNGKSERLQAAAVDPKKAAKERRFRRKKNEEGNYSASVEARTAVSDLRDEFADTSRSVLGKVWSVFKFIGHIFHILFRTLWRLLVAIAVVAIVCCVVAGIGVGYLYFDSATELPNIEDFTKVAMPQDSTIYDQDGEVIGVVSTVSRESIGFGEISQPMKDAIVSIEDERFYNHQGVDFQGILRALYVNYQEWRSGGSATSQGASTITQQYVRNAYEQIGTEQTMSRKLTEMMLAAQLEAEMSKDDILNSYLNTIYFGNGCYGIQAASKFYFGHGADSLDYYESAVLASIVNAPSIYDPTTEEGKHETASRANLVLDKMYSLGKLGDISQEDMRSLKQTDINTKLNITQGERAINQPFYYDYVMKELSDDYSIEEIESGGWQIYTTLSIADGQAATDVVASIEDKYEHNGITSAIADIDINTGAIHAFCGGVDYGFSQYNIATQGYLQTGSTLKPILYAALCEDLGYYMSDQMSCEPVDIGDPTNPHVIKPYLSGASGTLKQGLVASDNAMAIHAAQTLGMDKFGNMLKAVGIDTPIGDNVVGVIGGQEQGLTPLELASGYSTIARQGKTLHAWCIKSITDTLGNTVYEHKDEKASYAFSPEVSAQVIDAMCAAVDSAGWYNIPFDKQGWTIAAKTGTTDEDMDSWCVGFDHDRSVAIWVGGRDGKQTVDNSSYNTTTAFSSYFEKVGQTDSKAGWEKPQYKTMVPDIDKNQSLESYIEELQEKKLAIDIEYVSADNAPESKIVGVKNAGELINRGSAAIVQVVRDMVAVPDFTGMTPKEAYDKSEGLDLDFKVEYSTSGTSIPTITKQSVDSGDLVAKGTKVELNITVLIDEPSETTVQQVPVNGNDTALSLLQKERNDLKIQNDQLIHKLEDANNASAEAAKIKVPNVVGLSSTDAKQVLTSMGFQVSYTGDTGDKITSMNPPSSSSVAVGTLITLKSASTPEEKPESNTNNNTNTNRNSSTSHNSNTNNNSNRNNNSLSNSNSNSNGGSLFARE